MVEQEKDKTASKIAKKWNAKNLEQFFNFFGISRHAAYRLHKNHNKKFEAMCAGQMVIELGLTPEQIKAAATLTKKS